MMPHHGDVAPVSMCFVPDPYGAWKPDVPGVTKTTNLLIAELSFEGANNNEINGTYYTVIVEELKVGDTVSYYGVTGSIKQMEVSIAHDYLKNYMLGSVKIFTGHELVLSRWNKINLVNDKS